MSISSTRSLYFPTQSRKGHRRFTKSSDSFSSVKRTFSDINSSSEMNSATFESKKVRKVQALPSFRKPLKMTREAEKKAAKLLPLIEKSGKEAKESLLETIKYIETYRNTLLQIARYEPRKSLYIHPEKNLTPRPYHIQINIKDDESASIYILPKLHPLGKGSSKSVRRAIDYIHEVNVACATIDLRKETGTDQVQKEYSIQKLFNQANDLCFYSREIKKPKIKIMMPYGNFGSLERCLRPEGNKEFFTLFNQNQREVIFQQILAFVSKIHTAGYVIADIKPENMIIDYDGNHTQIMITDFGTSYLEKDTEASRYEGSPHYMAPEFIESWNNSNQQLEIGRPTDIYALGLTLWELFVGGTPPWMMNVQKLAFWMEPESYRTHYKHAKRYKKRSLERLIYHMMHPDPKKRPTIDSIIKKKPTLRLSSPTFGDVRLLTQSESLERFKKNQQANQNKSSDALPESCVYTLTQGKKRDVFFIQTSVDTVKAKQGQDGSIKIYKDKRTYRTYTDLRDYLTIKNLMHCLNFS